MAEGSSSKGPMTAVLLVVFGVVCLGGIGVFGVLAAIAIPNFVAMQLKAKRAEVPANVDGIKMAELSYDAAFDGFVAVPAEPRGPASVGKEPKAWESTGDWSRLGWTPDEPVRGSYWVDVTPGGFTVHGVCDVDGDGERAEFIATVDTNATMQTGRDVY